MKTGRPLAHFEFHVGGKDVLLILVAYGLVIAAITHFLSWQYLAQLIQVFSAITALIASVAAVVSAIAAVQTARVAREEFIEERKMRERWVEAAEERLKLEQSENLKRQNQEMAKREEYVEGILKLQAIVDRVYTATVREWEAGQLNRYGEVKTTGPHFICETWISEFSESEWKRHSDSLRDRLPVSVFNKIKDLWTTCREDGPQSDEVKHVSDAPELFALRNQFLNRAATIVREAGYEWKQIDMESVFDAE